MFDVPNVSVVIPFSGHRAPDQSAALDLVFDENWQIRQVSVCFRDSLTANPSVFEVRTLCAICCNDSTTWYKD